MDYKEWKKSEVKGFDVFLETGVCIRGFKKWDKRGFQEFFIEEFGFSINDDITYKQLKLLCEVLIPHAKTYYHPKRSK